MKYAPDVIDPWQAASGETAEYVSNILCMAGLHQFGMDGGNVLHRAEKCNIPGCSEGFAVGFCR